MTRILLLALTLAFPVGGCGATAPGVSLDGREFLSTSVTEGGVERPLVTGTRIRIGFAEARLTVSAGCNMMGATYRIEGGELLLGEAATTEIGCDPARHAQDDWVFGLLGVRPVVRLTGNELLLERSGLVVTLLDREVADPDLPLSGPIWTVDSIVSGEAVSSVPDGVLAAGGGAAGLHLRGE